ncbi:Na+/H+ antiporter NhaC family protein [Isoalcanivorax beigongshangi]|uniref:Na+/H+ antiporter NhaC family protein n=1 Tax=Isoalcanivorax beigongshangi TaxID=3238810 RepID=A0ABV4AH90_9GAMM
MNSDHAPTPRAAALLPLLSFLVLFLGSGLYFSATGVDYAFYQIKAPVVAMVAIVLALAMAGRPLSRSVDRLLLGVGHPNIMLMCLVFLLAGAFASVTQSIGSVDATVQMGLSLMPASAVLPALFIITAFIATAMGTSMGTIAAAAPIAVGFAGATGLSLPLAIGAVVGGAMFGDNLSMISDTTIAATRSQGAALRDKFRVNLWIALPAAVVTVVLLAALGGGTHPVASAPVDGWKVLPYVAVFLLALSGLHVLVVLMIGIVLAGGVGLADSGYGIAALSGAIYSGFESMFEIMLLSMLIGGLSQLLHDQGGTRWLIDRIQATTRRWQRAGARVGEAGIAALVVVSNLFVANNTVAIVVCGSMAKEIAEEYRVSPRRAASMLDLFSCVVQGLIPYGAQVLLACSIAGLSPLALMGAIHYCWMLGIAGVVALLVQRPR